MLESAGVELRQQGTNVGRDHLNICCPYCEEQKFHCGIHEFDLWFKCFVCGEGGSWFKLKKKLRKLYPKTKWDEVTYEKHQCYLKEKEEVTTDYKKPVYWRKITEDDHEILEWLETKPEICDLSEKDRFRGLPLGVAFDVGLMMGIGKLAGYIVFKNGNNINARKYNSDYPGPRWWKQIEDKPYLFGSEWVLKAQPKIGVITEGIFDALRIPLGYGVAILGSAVSEMLIGEIVRLFDSADKLILAMDKGANRNSVIQMRLMLMDMGFEVVVPDWNAINIPGVKDLDELFLATTEDDLFAFLGEDNSKFYEALI